MPADPEKEPGIVEGESGQLYGNIRVPDGVLGEADHLVPLEEVNAPADPPAASE